jgi:hypothetical protein
VQKSREVGPTDDTGQSRFIFGKGPCNMPLSHVSVNLVEDLVSMIFLSVCIMAFWKYANCELADKFVLRI